MQQEAARARGGLSRRLLLGLAAALLTCTSTAVATAAVAASPAAVAAMSCQGAGGHPLPSSEASSQQTCQPKYPPGKQACSPRLFVLQPGGASGTAAATGLRFKSARNHSLQCTQLPSQAFCTSVQCVAPTPQWATVVERRHWVAQAAHHSCTPGRPCAPYASRPVLLPPSMLALGMLAVTSVIAWRCRRQERLPSQPQHGQQRRCQGSSAADGGSQGGIARRQQAVSCTRAAHAATGTVVGMGSGGSLAGPHWRTVSAVWEGSLQPSWSCECGREGAAAGGCLASSDACNDEAAEAASGCPGSNQCMPLVNLRPGDIEVLVDAQGDFLVLGEGANAVVCQARLQGVHAVAAKLFELQPGADLQQVWSEVSLLRRCIHSRILPCYGVALQGNLLLVALKLMQGGSLRNALICPRTRDKLRWHARGRQVAVDVAEGLAFLHSRSILHSDLKPSNVLLTDDLRACIGDLGMAQPVLGQAKVVAGFSPSHAAPEQLLGERCTLAADVFSFGLLLIELTTRKLFSRRNGWRLPHTPQECSEGVLCLIQECISPDPACRPSAVEVLRRLRADCRSRS